MILNKKGKWEYVGQMNGKVNYMEQERQLIWNVKENDI